MSINLDCIFRPKSIAVVGASTKKGTIGYVMLNNLVRNGYRGEIYPVNPKADNIDSIKCYHSVAEIPGKVDLAIIVVPRDFVAPSLEECGKAGILGVIAITAGFKEIGGEGIQKEKDVVDIIRKYNMRMVGPNCYGVVNTEKTCSLNATFSKLNPIRGRVAFLSQSGALGEVVLDYTNRLNLGISMFISIGNKADISDIEVLQYWENNPGTDVILIYVENIENPDEFMRVARRITAHKPIIAVKAGRTESGAKAISSHTGVLAGGDVGIDAFFEKCGIMRAYSFEELFDIAMALANQPVPRGDRVAVITNAGGPGILATDAIETLGLKMARFEPATIEYLRANLLPMAAVNNPIDVIASGGPDAYGAATEASLKDPNVDALVVIFVPPMMIDHKAVLNNVIEKVKLYQDGKTVVACLMGSPSGIAGTEDLIANNIPVYAFPDGVARALAGMKKYRQFKSKPVQEPPRFEVDINRVREIIDEARKGGRQFIMGPEGMTILFAYGIKIPGSAKAKTEDELKGAISKLAPPFVMKTDDPQVVHKTEVGGVILNIKTTADAMTAFETMRRKFTRPDGSFRGVMIQEMITGGVETIIGMNLDSSVGSLLMFGLGGVSVEVMKDVAFKVNPLSVSEASEMVRSVKGFKLLNGFRGAPPVDFEALEETILRLSQLAVDFPELESFDVNPFIASPEKCRSVAVDARFVLKV
jgi:acetyltransferase